MPASNSITTPEMDFPSLLERALFAGGAGKKVRVSLDVSATISHKAGNAVEGSWCVKSCIFWGCYIAFSILLGCPLMHCNLLSNWNRKRELKVKFPMLIKAGKGQNFNCSNCFSEAVNKAGLVCASKQIWSCLCAPHTGRTLP